MYLDENSHHNRKSSFDDSFERSAERSGKEFDEMKRKAAMGDILPGLFSELDGQDNHNEASYQHRTGINDRIFGDSSS